MRGTICPACEFGDHGVDICLTDYRCGCPCHESHAKASAIHALETLRMPLLEIADGALRIHQHVSVLQTLIKRQPGQSGALGAVLKCTLNDFIETVYALSLEAAQVEQYIAEKHAEAAFVPQRNR